MPELNARQMQIALLIARGLDTDQIAKELSSTPGSIKTTISHMYDMLGIDGRGDGDARVKVANLVRERGWK